MSNIHCDRIYIGSSSNYLKRKYEHILKLKQKKHSSPKLQNHFNKYGSKDLEFIVLERMQVVDRKYLLEREQHYIDTLKPFFNCNPTAGSSFGYKWTEEQLKRYADNRKPISEETRMKLSKTSKGRKMPEEAKEKIRQWHLGRKNPESANIKNSIRMMGKKHAQGHVCSEEVKRGWSEKRKGKTCTEETREKLRIISTGKIHTEERKRNIQNSKKYNKLKRKLNLEDEMIVSIFVIFLFLFIND